MKESQKESNKGEALPVSSRGNREYRNIPAALLLKDHETAEKLLREERAAVEPNKDKIAFLKIHISEMNQEFALRKATTADIPKQLPSTQMARPQEFAQVVSDTVNAIRSNSQTR